MGDESFEEITKDIRIPGVIGWYDRWIQEEKLHPSGHRDRELSASERDALKSDPTRYLLEQWEKYCEPQPDTP
jgi:hypothetical protein